MFHIITDKYDVQENLIKNTLWFLFTCDYCIFFAKTRIMATREKELLNNNKPFRNNIKLFSSTLMGTLS